MGEPAVAAPSANSEVCSKMFRDFPNSLDNSAICNKVESEGKKLDWLRKNRALCEESKDFFDNFISKSCGALWCDFAAPQLDDWSAEANSSGVGVARASRAELNQFKLRGGAKQSRTSSKLPSSFNAQTETKPLC